MFIHFFHCTCILYILEKNRIQLDLNVLARNLKAYIFHKYIWVYVYYLYVTHTYVLIVLIDTLCIVYIEKNMYTSCISIFTVLIFLCKSTVLKILSTQAYAGSFPFQGWKREFLSVIAGQTPDLFITYKKETDGYKRKFLTIRKRILPLI